MQFRWFILVLLFSATTILYIDRSALGILAPDLQRSIGWSEEQYGYINTAFMIAYAVCFLIMGTIIGRIGTKKGYLLSISIWGLATAAHVLAGRWIGFALGTFTLESYPSPPGSLGHCSCQIYDRSHLVVLSFLGCQISE
jgi:ACS family hexuronate transporter-like MFS transporter